MVGFSVLSCSRRFLTTDVSGMSARVATVGLFVLLVLVHVFSALSVKAQSSGVEQDRAALVALYETADGPNWVYRTNWLSDVPLGDWYGVNTDVAGRVVSLYLKGTPGSFLRKSREKPLH